MKLQISSTLSVRCRCGNVLIIYKLICYIVSSVVTICKGSCACFLVVADVLERVRNREIIWTERPRRTLPHDEKIDFDGVPFVTIGRQLLHCCYGKGSNTSAPKSAVNYTLFMFK